jgi:hypothetical protein
MSEAPRIFFDDPRVLIKSDFDLLLMSKYDVFYRRIVELVLSDIEGTRKSDHLCTVVDGAGNEYEMHLNQDGYVKSLAKAKEYFLVIEEYETCALIDQMSAKFE